MKILIIEDERLLAQSLQLALQRRGFQVELAHDGETGAAYADTGVYDLLVLDVMMPGMDGYTLARHVRSRHGAVPILMLGVLAGLCVAIAAVLGLEKHIDSITPSTKKSSAWPRIR